MISHCLKYKSCFAFEFVRKTVSVVVGNRCRDCCCPGQEYWEWLLNGRSNSDSNNSGSSGSGSVVVVVLVVAVVVHPGMTTR